MHVIGLCETFLNNDIKGMASLENYTAIHECRMHRQGSGTTLLVHDSVCHFKQIIPPFRCDFESVAAEILYGGEQILVAEVYRPPNSDNQKFNEGLMELLTITDKYK